MKPAPRTVLVTLVAAGAACVFACGPRGGEVKFPDPLPQPATPPGGAAAVPIGMSGCLGAACHGGPAARTLAGEIGPDTWQGSGSCWAAADPHAGAYSLLTEHPYRKPKVTAQEIMAKYAPGKSAEDEPRCVACHTNPALATAERFAHPEAHALRNEGVSCEACHGNAGQWLRPHTALEGDRTAFYRDTGMTPLFDLGVRALTCAGCHVGAPAENGLPVRDMNHDMIAAGHPRLNFDFAEYLRRLPHHWQEKDRTANTKHPPPVERNSAKVWLVGRAAHAEAACKLLASRAERSATDPQTPWPEFAEYSCAACHHGLRAPDSKAPVEDTDWRKDARYTAGRPLGTPGWQIIWPMTAAPGLGARPDGWDGIGKLRDQIGKLEQSRFKRADVPGVAKTGFEAMGKLRRELTAAKDGDVFYGAAQMMPVAPALPEWDSAAQLFYGLAALERARGGTSAERLKKYDAALRALRTNDWPHVKWQPVLDALNEIQRKP